MKLTLAQYNALAYTYLTGSMPKYLHQQTWKIVYGCIEGREPKYQLKQECINLVKDHPQVLLVKQLQVDGWRVADLGRRKVKDGLTLRRPGQFTFVFPDGRQSEIYNG